MKPSLERTLDLMNDELTLAGYSPKTVSSYLGVASRFLRHTDKPTRRLTHDDVRQYMLFLTREKQAASSTINQAHFGIRFLYVRVLKKSWRTELQLHKRPQRVPIVLARDEIDQLLRTATDMKYRTIWMTLYACGLRLSEALRLRVTDIDSKAMRILVRNGKGRKDRYTVLSQSLLEQLRAYWKAYRPKEWMFYGRDRQEHLNLRTVQKTFQADKKRAGIHKRATPHSLRHSFATHSMEDGANLLYIRDLLGHRAIKSTLVYLKVTAEGIDRLVNPLDRMMELRRSKVKNTRDRSKSQRRPRAGTKKRASSKSRHARGGGK